jgi:glutaredoxin
LYVLLTTKDCKYCIAAKELLTELGHDYDEFDISELPDLREFFVSNGYRTVPQIFHHGHRIGGYDMLTQYLNNRIAN